MKTERKILEVIIDMIYEATDGGCRIAISQFSDFNDTDEGYIQSTKRLFGIIESEIKESYDKGKLQGIEESTKRIKELSI